MSILHVSFIRADLQWENSEANLRMFTQQIEQISGKVDLIVLPEMFSTGFSMEPERLAETEQGKSVAWMKQIAFSTNAVITGSLIIEESGKFYNRLFWVRPDGNYETYNKRHLFSLAGEENHYANGTERLVVELNGFKIMPLICYDLRFPVWSRNDLGYDVLLYVANWPERRSFYWKQLLIARAIENQSYVIGVNRVGNDKNEVSHSGDSVCLDPLGKEVGVAQLSKPEIVSVILSKDTVNRVRDKFKFLNDKDEFEISD